MLFTCKKIVFSDFTWEKKFTPGNGGGGAGAPCSASGSASLRRSLVQQWITMAFGSSCVVGIK